MEINGIRAGQRVRVTTLQTVRGWQGQHLITVPLGRQCDGIVQNVTDDGFFELCQESGEKHSFNAYDQSISVTHILE